MVIALIVLLLKNDVRPISFTPTANALLWFLKSSARRGSKWEDCDSAVYLPKYSAFFKPEEWEVLASKQEPV